MFFKNELLSVHITSLYKASDLRRLEAFLDEVCVEQLACVKEITNYKADVRMRGRHLNDISLMPEPYSYIEESMLRKIAMAIRNTIEITVGQASVYFNHDEWVIDLRHTIINERTIMLSLAVSAS